VQQLDYTGSDQTVAFLDQADPPGRDYFSCGQVHLLAIDINKRYRLPNEAPLWIGNGLDDADLSTHTWGWWVRDIKRTARRTPDKTFCLVSVQPTREVGVAANGLPVHA
jgi:hypothetical protein